MAVFTHKNKASQGYGKKYSEIVEIIGTASDRELKAWRITTENCGYFGQR